jgi:nitrogen fixation NifU-like protein
MDDLYQEQILDHYKNPRHFGKLENADVVVRETNASCGDELELSLRLEYRISNIGIKEAKFTGVGCAISVAATSLLLVKLNEENWSLEKVAVITKEEMEELLGIPVSETRRKCMMLSVRALRKANDEKK